MEVKTFYILPKIEKIKTEDITVKDTLRITVAEENILNLASNIKKNGLISPLYVRKDINCPKKYILVSGYRRLKALSFLGVKTVPAVVLSLTDAEAMLLPLCSEQLKEEICPFERAFYMAKSLKAGVTKNELAKFLGEQCVGVDVNSMKPLDNLCHPISVIREAEERQRMPSVPLTPSLW